jgi:hypothetical protein
MRRAAQANWSRLPNHNPPRFYTAWVRRVDFVMSALGPVCSQQQTFPDSVGTSRQEYNFDMSFHSCSLRPDRRQ